MDLFLDNCLRYIISIIDFIISLGYLVSYFFNKDCIWFILVGSGKKIVFMFIIFDVKRGLSV